MKRKIIFSLIILFGLLACNVPTFTGDAPPTVPPTPEPPRIPTEPRLTWTPLPTDPVTPSPEGTLLPTFTATISPTSILERTGVPTLTSTGVPPTQSPADGTAAAAQSLLVNWSFEEGSNRPTGWNVLDIDSDDVRDCSQSTNGSCSWRFVGSGRLEKIFQSLSFLGGRDERFLLTWKTKIQGTANCAGFVEVIYDDNTTEIVESRISLTGQLWVSQNIGFVTDRPYQRIDVVFTCDAILSAPVTPPPTSTYLPTFTLTPTYDPTKVDAVVWIDEVRLTRDQ